MMYIIPKSTIKTSPSYFRRKGLRTLLKELVTPSVCRRSELTCARNRTPKNGKTDRL